MIKKSVLQSVLIGVILSFAVAAYAAIPRASFIIEKLAKQSGNGTYQIEQDVVFTTPNSTMTLREIWLVSTDGQMRLTVRAPRENQEQVKVQFVYGGGQKNSLTQSGRRSGKISDEFLERWLHTRSTDVLFNQLSNLKILPMAYLGHRPARSAREKSFNYPPEPLVRLTRSSGVITYGLGEPSTEGNLRPMAWIEQDIFRLRKLRFPSGATLTADNFGTYARSLALPKTRHISWNQNSVEIQLVKVTPLAPQKNNKLLQASSIDIASNIGGLPDAELQRTIEEFYSRFR